MKIFILAAGQGTRLRPLTNDLPKCMVKYQGKRLIDQLLECVNLFEFNEKIMITGYKDDVLQSHLLSEKITYVHNEAYEHTNMVSTLFCAKHLMDEEMIISYSDIIYTPTVLKSLIDSEHEISVVIDRKWKELWLQRMDNPLDDAESLKICDGQIVELGQKVDGYEEIQGQYIGLIKISKCILPQVIEVYQNLDRSANYDGKDFQNMYMTSFIQKLIDLGFKVSPVYIDGGWIEVDSVEDLNAKMLGNGSCVE